MLAISRKISKINNFPLSKDVFSFREDSFYYMIEQFCGKQIVDFFNWNH